MWSYRSREVARLLGLTVEEVRRFARAGFVAPRRGPRNALHFSFQDLVLLRAAAGLVQRRLPASRVRRALRRLATQLPEGRALASVRVSAEGDAVVVRDGGTRWQPETGQTLLDFEARDLARTVAPLARAAALRRVARPLDAESLYQWGLGLADAAPAEARAAYRRALELDSHHAGAHLELGRMLREDGDPRAAEYHLRLAAPSPVHRAGACLELGGALEDQELPDEALLAYARALEAAPGLAAARERAARLLERLGQPESLRPLQAGPGSSPRER